MSRVPYPDPDTLSPEKRDILAGSMGRVLNVSHMAMHAPDPLWLAQRRLGRAAVYDATLDPQLREMLILRVAYLSGSEYELFHHLTIAENLGVTADQREAMRTGDFSGLTEQARAMAEFVTQVVCDVSPSDAVLHAARAHFSDALIFEMVVLIGSYMITARVAAVSGAPLDDTPVAGWTR